METYNPQQLRRDTSIEQDKFIRTLNESHRLLNRVSESIRQSERFNKEAKEFLAEATRLLDDVGKNEFSSGS